MKFAVAATGRLPAALSNSDFSIIYSLWLKTERRLGEILQDMPEPNGGDAARTRCNCVTEPKLTLADLGIDKRTSSRAGHSLAHARVKR